MKNKAKKLYIEITENGHTIIKTENINSDIEVVNLVSKLQYHAFHYLPSLKNVR